HTHRTSRLMTRKSTASPSVSGNRSGAGSASNASAHGVASDATVPGIRIYNGRSVDHGLVTACQSKVQELEHERRNPVHVQSAKLRVHQDEHVGRPDVQRRK